MNLNEYHNFRSVSINSFTMYVYYTLIKYSAFWTIRHFDTKTILHLCYSAIYVSTHQDAELEYNI